MISNWPSPTTAWPKGSNCDGHRPRWSPSLPHRLPKPEAPLHLTLPLRSRWVMLRAAKSSSKPALASVAALPERLKVRPGARGSASAAEADQASTSKEKQWPTLNKRRLGGRSLTTSGAALSNALRLTLRGLSLNSAPHRGMTRTTANCLTGRKL
ncbi:hypothetical protein [Caulobacter phage Cd1]|uniref:Uncharacterized protein n=1 Tax=Caulobacter phage Cd1 TaxID=718008 RepID=F1ADR3_9CAUD|nr:hypothetical protein [Caulobacter phage Cd1]